jgi:hypothetical protein
MGPFSTKYPQIDVFGADARSAAKYGAGTIEFWSMMVISSLYFSGIMHEIDFICPFPGHDPSAADNEMKQGLAALLMTLGRCFNKDYMRDLIIRHHASIKSQSATAAQKTFRNQLNTLRLNPYPHHNEREPYK